MRLPRLPTGRFSSKGLHLMSHYNKAWQDISRRKKVLTCIYCFGVLAIIFPVLNRILWDLEILSPASFFFNLDLIKKFILYLYMPIFITGELYLFSFRCPRCGNAFLKPLSRGAFHDISNCHYHCPHCGLRNKE